MAFINWRNDDGDLASLNINFVAQFTIDMDTDNGNDMWFLTAEIHLGGRSTARYLAKYTSLEAAEWGLYEMLETVHCGAFAVPENNYTQAAYDRTHPKK